MVILKVLRMGRTFKRFYREEKFLAPKKQALTERIQKQENHVCKWGASNRRLWMQSLLTYTRIDAWRGRRSNLFALQEHPLAAKEGQAGRTSFSGKYESEKVVFGEF